MLFPATLSKISICKKNKRQHLLPYNITKNRYYFNINKLAILMFQISNEIGTKISIEQCFNWWLLILKQC